MTTGGGGTLWRIEDTTVREYEEDGVGDVERPVIKVKKKLTGKRRGIGNFGLEKFRTGTGEEKSKRGDSELLE